MFTRKFIFDLFERIFATAAQALLATLTVSDLDWGQKFQITAVAALASFLKGIVASQIGQPSTAALLPESVTHDEGGQGILGLILGIVGLCLVIWGAYTLATVALSVTVVVAIVIGIVLMAFAWGGLGLGCGGDGTGRRW